MCEHDRELVDNPGAGEREALVVPPEFMTCSDSLD